MRRLLKARLLILAPAASLVLLPIVGAVSPASGEGSAASVAQRAAASGEDQGAAPGADGRTEARAGRRRKRRKRKTKLVRIMDNFFSPRSVRVRRRGRVTWVWKGQNTHNVTFVRVPRRASKRGARDRDSGRFTRSFKKKGIYSYVCTNHDGMRGWIRVR